MYKAFEWRVRNQLPKAQLPHDLEFGFILLVAGYHQFRTLNLHCPVTRLRSVRYLQVLFQQVSLVFSAFAKSALAFGAVLQGRSVGQVASCLSRWSLLAGNVFCLGVDIPFPAKASRTAFATYFSRVQQVALEPFPTLPWLFIGNLLSNTVSSPRSTIKQRLLQMMICSPPPPPPPFRPVEGNAWKKINPQRFQVLVQDYSDAIISEYFSSVFL